MTARPAQLCQLAGEWKGSMPLGGMLVEQKHDGFRCLWFRGHDGKPRLWTRNGMPIEGCAHIAWRLSQMEEAAGRPLFIDGELVVDGTLAATKHWVETGWRAGGEKGTLYAFDVLDEAEWRAGGTDRPLIERKKALSGLFGATVDDWEWRPGSRGRDEALPPVVILPDSWCFTPADVVAEARRVWAAGGEGLMLKDALSPYQRNRSDAWLKVKADNKWMRGAA